MSSIKARLMKPTGLEFHDTAFELDREIFNFLKHEYKNKSKEENSQLPVRYWQTHAVPIHRECWKLISEITYANSVYPTNEDELKERKMHQQNAIGCCYNQQRPRKTCRCSCGLQNHVGCAWYKAEFKKDADHSDQTLFVHACTIPYNEDRKGSDAPEQKIVYPDEKKAQNVRRAFESRNNDI